ncbi:M16 family metallopeptidase [Polaribacter sp. IC073]|uniref:M16 family metallopeptidase n=1 Tax=Polaribacter sp. IC073 TaxID=2508540 RepID=UPI0011BE25DB|nr:insulinase family protein [Polaribacter sp. IC073]TXD46750.1 insulinase family protein [Polaribacter sp. IC073]
MKKLILFLVLLIGSNLHAQDLDLNTQLPTNNIVKKGVLKNGLTYYIYNTDVTKDAASYYIIQNVGSVLENDKQQGLAHFLEHMAFNGTKNFAGKGVLNTLQKEGAVFGQDINAYTAFDETVYNMNNIPATPELIDTCLLILRDWSNGLLLTDEEIDAERGVIKEEWRTRQSGGMRIFKQSLPVMFNNTIYAERMPIGLMDIVANFEYKTLRDFYHDWYRTDLQAIAIIGDVDVEEVEAKIEKLFSNIPAIENPKERFIVNIPDNEEMLYALVQDKEVTTAQIEFGIRHQRPKTYAKVKDLKDFLIENMITSMFSARISELTQNPNTPFLGARINYSKNSRATSSFSASISPKPNQQQKAFKATLTEINRAVKFGFTQEEIDRAIVQFKNYYQTQISKESDKSHAAIVYEIQQNYLENITMVDISKQYQFIEKIVASLKKEDIHQRLKQLYTANNRSLIVTGVNGKNNLSEEEAKNIINLVENDTTIIAYADAFSGKTLISNVDIKSGTIISEKKNKEVEATTFKLSNGIKVHYKYTNKNKNDVKLEAVSYGGLSLINDEDLPSAKYASTVVQQSGLGDYSATDLTKVLAGKTASTYIDITALNESINGSSVTKDAETMLQMVHLRFVKPRFDEDAYKVFKGQVDNYLIRRSENINEKIQDSVTVALYGKNNPKKTIFNTNFASKINFNKIKNIYAERFADASDFEFFIVGDIDENTLKPLLEKYIASIPTNNTKEVWKDNSTPWLHNTIDKDVFLKMEDPKSTVRISYKNDYKYSLKNNIMAQALADILSLRYMDLLREDEGGTYGASAYGSVTKRPNEQANLWVQFDCNPDKVEKLVAIVHSELKKVAAGVISEADLEKTKNNYLKEYKQQQDYNSYEMSLLVNFYREGYNMNASKNFEDIVKNLKVKDIKTFAKNLIANAKSYEIIIKPLKDPIEKMESK